MDASISVVDENGDIVDVEAKAPTFFEEKDETKEEVKEVVPEEEVVVEKTVVPKKKKKTVTKGDIVVDLGDLKKELKMGIPIKKHCSDGKIRKRHLVMSSAEIKFKFRYSAT